MCTHTYTHTHTHRGGGEIHTARQRGDGPKGGNLSGDDNENGQQQGCDSEVVGCVVQLALYLFGSMLCCLVGLLEYYLMIECFLGWLGSEVRLLLVA